LSFPAGKYDDQVDALGLIGQLLDRITAEQKPKKPDEKKRDPCREAFDEFHEWSFKLHAQVRAASERRSTRDLLNILDTIAKAGAGFKSLTDTWADTTTAHGRLMLTVLGGLAEFERELILARTGDGRRRAKARKALLKPISRGVTV
jgi:Resolvase, N terminal domain